MKKRRLLMVAFIGLVMLGAVVWFWPTTPPPPGVTLENFRRIRIGMSMKDAEAVLGERHGWMLRAGGALDIWDSKEGVVTLRFSDDKVAHGDFFQTRGCEIETLPEPLLDRLRRWLSEW